MKQVFKCTICNVHTIGMSSCWKCGKSFYEDSEDINVAILKVTETKQALEKAMIAYDVATNRVIELFEILVEENKKLQKQE